MSHRRAAPVVLLVVGLAACQTAGTIVIESESPCPADVHDEPVDVDVYLMRSAQCPADPCGPFECPAEICQHVCIADCGYQDLDEGIGDLDPPPGDYAVLLDFAYADGTYGFTCVEVTFDADGTRSYTPDAEAYSRTCCS